MGGDFIHFIIIYKLFPKPLYHDFRPRRNVQENKKLDLRVKGCMEEIPGGLFYLTVSIQTAHTRSFFSKP